LIQTSDFNKQIRVFSIKQALLNLALTSVICFFFAFPESQSQSRYQVVSYEKSIHGGGNQNWGISISNSGDVFVANNSGLIVLDGAQPKLLKLPAETIIRSVACIGERVYTGSFEEFGYWQQETFGDWKYYSLIPLLKDIELNNDEIWKIIEHNNAVYFQSFGNIFVYDGQSISALTIPGPVLFLLKAGNRLFAQEINGPLNELINNQLVKIPSSEIFSSTEIKAILPFQGDSLLIGTSTQGLYTFFDHAFSPWNSEADQELKAYQLNNGIMLNDNYVFGTLLKGVLVVNKHGEVKHHLHTGNALQNNTVLALHSDIADNLWVCMDKGLDYVWFNSPVEVYNNSDMELGAVYSACTLNDKLYVGTNQGVYVFNFQNGYRLGYPSLLENSQGQVWFLKNIDGQIYCGTNNGTFVVNKDKMLKVSNVNGGYNLTKLTTFEKDYYIQSTYNNLVLFEKNDGFWKQSEILKGFVAPVRFLETDYLGNLIAGHTISGIYKLQLSADFRTVENIKKLGPTEGLTKTTNRIFKVSNRILIPDGNEIFQWSADEGKVVSFNELNSQLSEFTKSKTIVPVSNSFYWFITSKAIGMFELRLDKANLRYRLIPEMFGLDLVQDYENIIPLNDSLHLIGLEEGFALLNTKKLDELDEIMNPPEIKEILFSKDNSNFKRIPSDLSGFQINSNFNNFRVSFSSAETVGCKKYFQYKLEGIEDKWSEWSGKTQILYSRLPPGNYTFRVQTLTAKGMITPEASVNFIIRRPWFSSIVASVFYVLIFIAMIAGLRILYKKRKWKQQEAILLKENEKIRRQKDWAIAENIRLNNEKLQSEVAMKNMQLAKNTLAIIRKNEALIEIKDELEQQKTELGYRLPAKYYESLHRLIERNISQDHDWQIFEQLFDQAHENFFQRLKNYYPNLTSSDLRLCAYLRINLSSKEIAPLLNITIRGVEEKRYRLRKRLNLESDQSLTDFIIHF